MKQLNASGMQALDVEQMAAIEGGGKLCDMIVGGAVGHAVVDVGLYVTATAASGAWIAVGVGLAVGGLGCWAGWWS